VLMCFVAGGSFRISSSGARYSPFSYWLGMDGCMEDEMLCYQLFRGFVGIT